MWKDRAQFVGTVGVGAVAIVGLHRFRSRVPIDWSDPVGWLSRSPIEDAVTEVARILGLGLSYWFVISTVLYFMAVLSDAPGFIRAIEWATIPAVRSVTRRVAAVTLATSMAGPAAVLLAPPAPEPAAPPAAAADLSIPPSEGPGPIVNITDDGVVIPPGYQEPAEPAYHPTVGVPDSTPTPVSDVEPTVAGTSAQDQTTSYSVEEGDNLWSISERHLATVTDTAPSETEVVGYWSKVIETNVAHLVSGDPDLIYPGEVIQLPSIEGKTP